MSELEELRIMLERYYTTPIAARGFTPWDELTDDETVWREFCRITGTDTGWLDVDYSKSPDEGSF